MKRFLDKTDNLGLSNLAKNINIKRIQLGISLKKFATLSKVSYSNLNKIVNQEPSMPTLSTLKKLSDFLNIKVADILKYGDLPQYIPKFIKNEYLLIEKYLNNSKVSIKNKDFSESFIDDKAFSLEFEVNVLGKEDKITYYFSPDAEIKIGKMYLIKITNRKVRNFDFVEIINETFDLLLVKSIFSEKVYNLKNEQIELLGIAVKRKLASNF